MVNIHHDDEVTSLWGIPYLYSTSGLYYGNKSGYLRFFHTTRKMPANINQQWKPTNPQSLWAGYLISLQKFCQHKQIWPLRDLIWTDTSGLTTLRSVLHAFWVCSRPARHKQQRQISPSWSCIPSHLPLQQRLQNALCYRNQEVKMICLQSN